MRKKLNIILITISFASTCFGQPGFKESQQAYSRVREAYREKGEQVLRMLAPQDMTPGTLELYLVAFKKEKQLELWSRNEGEEEFSLLRSYDICRTSVKPGPKRKQGIPGAIFIYPCVLTTPTAQS